VRRRVPLGCLQPVFSSDRLQAVSTRRELVRESLERHWPICRYSGSERQHQCAAFCPKFRARRMAFGRTGESRSAGHAQTLAAEPPVAPAANRSRSGPKFCPLPAGEEYVE